MAGGPLFPSSIGYPTNGLVYPGYRVGGSNSRQFGGHRAAASLGSDAVLELIFEMPQSLPTGTGKLRASVVANATSGNGVINPSWASLANGENYDTISLTAEGNTTVTWSTGNADQVLEALITLDADTIVADEYVVMRITFVSGSWTLAQISTWQFSIVWQ